ncbi:SemiSWEET transporter [Enterovirga aerilata]|uniref:SemiSWEET transporter n=1 Tax=Enterovirga aerilata TaxID=2730920 RepID=A0A849ICD3_9HYPH|nr:SemiSWEET transporter [Enterovirga sp. DB1703]NNM74931.1 SemiSWEET transporter [Enterovirga sp. DB1703]
MSTIIAESVGGAAAILTTFCWVPQAIRTIRLRDTRAISLPAQLAFGTGLALWLTYGLMIASWPLIAANAVSLALVSVIVATKLRYG